MSAPSPESPQRPPPLERGLHTILVLLVASAIGAAAGVASLLPRWIAAAAAGRPGAVPVIWVALALALTAAGAALGIWRRRSWAREAFFLWAVIASLWQLAIVIASGVGDEVAGAGWLGLAGAALAGLALGGVLVVYVWRHARFDG